MNRCWTEGDPDGLPRYFHEHMVAVTPAIACRYRARGLRGRLVGLRAVHEDSVVGDARRGVRLHGDAAVVTYRYEMECERGGKRLRPAGRDLMVLARHEGRWQVVADSFSPDPEG